MTDPTFPPPATPVPPPAGAATVTWWKRKKFGLPVWAYITIAVVILAAAAGAGKKKDETTIAKSPDPTAAATVDATAPETTAAAVPETTDAPTTTKATTTTSTSTTTTLPPTTTTIAPQVYAGHGDDVIDLGEGNTRFILQATHNGGSNFIVEELDANLQTVGFDINEIGSYSGTVLLEGAASSSNSVRYVKITADGDWTANLLDVAQLRAVTDPAFMGHGDDVILYSGNGGIYSITHNGGSNFIVHVITAANEDGLINEIGAYAGRQPIPKGPAIIIVNADGDWTFTS